MNALHLNQITPWKMMKMELLKMRNSFQPMMFRRKPKTLKTWGILPGKIKEYLPSHTHSSWFTGTAYTESQFTGVDVRITHPTNTSCSMLGYFHLVFPTSRQLSRFMSWTTSWQTIWNARLLLCIISTRFVGLPRDLFLTQLR